MRSAWLLCLLLAMTPLASSAPAGIDLHDYWDQRCMNCHGHAGEFARRSLRVVDGQLQGAHHRTNLNVFLRHHYLSDSLIEPVSAMLIAQLMTPPVYATHCRRCHGTAAEFARGSLSLRDGVLQSAPSARALAQTLASHGGLSPSDARVVIDTLTRVRREVAGGAR